MRRRHGIPDDDHRPFNVAYAAALQARKKREGRGPGARQAPQEDLIEDGQQFPPRPSDAMTCKYNHRGWSSNPGTHLYLHNLQHTYHHLLLPRPDTRMAMLLRLSIPGTTGTAFP